MYPVSVRRRADGGRNFIHGGVEGSDRIEDVEGSRGKREDGTGSALTAPVGMDWKEESVTDYFTTRPVGIPGVEGWGRRGAVDRCAARWRSRLPDRSFWLSLLLPVLAPSLSSGERQVGRAFAGARGFLSQTSRYLELNLVSVVILELWKRERIDLETRLPMQAQIQTDEQQPAVLSKPTRQVPVPILVEVPQVGVHPLNNR
ncbi:hypothetical protein QBC40DRAFT_353046 [Triangularia verruculosa]|uniref:Uncharacterized protein n=1 Tax=Triangularia verruculosa TaxID=2587418 RepID=A0AAN6X9W7_9PEZI|nr:hypothetical protein QBC40DRAFT_353046 [Triangularia verruculosa]